MLEKGVTGGGEALSKAITAVINVRNVYMRGLIQGMR